jgi:hypothetical protein
MATETIREFLVSLGYKQDEAALRKFEQGIGDAWYRFLLCWPCFGEFHAQTWAEYAEWDFGTFYEEAKKLALEIYQRKLLERSKPEGSA